MHSSPRQAAGDSAKDLAKYDPGRPVRLTTFRPERSYTLEDFIKALPNINKVKSDNVKPLHRESMSGNVQLPNPNIDYERIIRTSIMTFPVLMKKDIAEPLHIMRPWLSEGTLSMISSPTGVGKTFLCLSIALAITRSVPIGRWQPENPVGCLYIDGEMPPSEIKKMIKRLSKNLPKEKAPLYIMSVPLMIKGGTPPLTLTKEWFDAITKYLTAQKDIKVIIIDNLSSLSSNQDENAKL